MLRGILKKIMLMEDISWRQISRMLWFKGINTQSSFTGLQTLIITNDTIGTSVVEGEVITNEDKINTTIVDYYQALFSEPGVRWPPLDGLEFSAIENETLAGWNLQG